LPFHNDHLTITPALLLALSGSSSTYGLQWSLTPYAPQHLSSPWQVGLAVERHHSLSSPSQVSLSLDLSSTF
ncbi:MAG TPA: hypothetical protein DD643_00840, partial [Synechococcus sp. UBA8638]|nr:hypothetical protein [Synechococcus sp. UBA8638]